MRSVALITAAFALSIVMRAAGEDAPTAVFTEQQATAGRAAYGTHCASCHMPDLSGNAEIPPLAGPTFIETWRNRTTKDLRDYMSAAMPYGGPALEAETYTVITAYVLRANGATAGDEKLSASTARPLSGVIPKRSLLN